MKMGQVYVGRILLLVLVVCLLGGCSGIKTPSIAVELPEKYNTPDGMVLGKDNNIYLCCPNFNNDKHPAKLLKIRPDDGPAKVFQERCQKFKKDPPTDSWDGVFNLTVK